MSDNLGNWLAGLLEKRKQDAQKAGVLRKAFAVYDSENKDQYAAMGLEELEGHVQAMGMQRAQAQLEQEKVRTAEAQQQLQAGKTFQGALSRMRTGGQTMMDASRASAPVLRALASLGLGGGPAADQIDEAGSQFQPDAQNILQTGLESGVDPGKVATLADSMARIETMGRRGTKNNLRFVTSPTGATIALSADTGAFQYDPYSKAQAEGATLSKKDAIKVYNGNQARINQIRTQMKMAEDPENAILWDADALKAELDDLESQQPDLRRVTGLGGSASTATKPAPTATPTKKRRYNPKTGKIE